MKKIAIIGGGPTNMIAASFLANSNCEVHLFEAKSTLGRKFLVAGKGGFNLSHHEDIDLFASRYRDQSPFFKQILNAFSPDDLRNWLGDLGIETFVGTSNRIFPIKGITPAMVLKAIQDDLVEKGVQLHFNHKMIDFSEKEIVFETKNGIQKSNADIIIFALGGASWSKTGSDGKWKSLFESKGIQVNDFEPSNCGFYVDWSKDILDYHIGKPLKNIAISSGDECYKGEVVLTEKGLEGSPVYALSAILKEQLKMDVASISIDFKPNLSRERILEKLQKSKSPISQSLRKDLKLSSVSIAILKQFISKDNFLDKEILSQIIKAVKIPIIGIAPMDEAISTTGGIDFSEVQNDLSLKKYPNVYVGGEMLDWDAPTGGYLLQGAFSMGRWIVENGL